MTTFARRRETLRVMYGICDSYAMQPLYFQADAERVTMESKVASMEALADSAGKLAALDKNLATLREREVRNSCLPNI